MKFQMPMTSGKGMKQNKTDGLNNGLCVLTVMNTYRMNRLTTYTVNGYVTTACPLMKERFYLKDR